MFLCSFYPKTLTLRTREEANTAYLKGLETYARQKGTVILVAPYGGVNQIGKKVKYGVRKLMEKRVSMLLSYSCWSVRHAAFATRLVPHTGSMDAAFRTLLSQ